MRAWCALLMLACGCSAGEGGADFAVPADLAPPTSVLILGLWQEPGSGYILRFTPDGKQELAATIAELDTNPMLTGTWSTDGQRLTFTSETGLCSSPSQFRVGYYVITVTPSELTFTVDLDACPQRKTIDDETWTRPSTDGGA